jgi:hypothetical protein
VGQESNAFGIIVIVSQKSTTENLLKVPGMKKSYTCLKPSQPFFGCADSSVVKYLRPWREWKNPD